MILKQIETAVLNRQWSDLKSRAFIIVISCYWLLLPNDHCKMQC